MDPASTQSANAFNFHFEQSDHKSWKLVRLQKSHNEYIYPPLFGYVSRSRFQCSDAIYHFDILNVLVLILWFFWTMYIQIEYNVTYYKSERPFHDIESSMF